MFSEFSWSRSQSAKMSVYQTFFWENHYFEPFWLYEPSKRYTRLESCGSRQKFKNIIFLPSCEASDFWWHLRTGSLPHSCTVSYESWKPTRVGARYAFASKNSPRIFIFSKSAKIKPFNSHLLCQGEPAEGHVCDVTGWVRSFPPLLLASRQLLLRVAKCQFFYWEKILSPKFYPKKRLAVCPILQTGPYLKKDGRTKGSPKKNWFFMTFSKKTETPQLPLFWPLQFFLIRIFWIGRDPPFGEIVKKYQFFLIRIFWIGRDPPIFAEIVKKIPFFL